MIDKATPEALSLADSVAEEWATGGISSETIEAVGEKLRRQHARIAELEAQIEAVGAGGVSGPLMGRASPQSPSFDAADMATAAAQAVVAEPVAIRPDIQAVLAMLDVPVIARMSSHAGKLLKPGQEPPAFESAVPLVREWDHRRACESIIATLSGNN